jgi:hypothetical protein
MCWSSKELEYVGQKRNFGGRCIAVAFPCSCHLGFTFPSTVKKMQAFLGMVNFYKEIPAKYFKRVVNTL